MSPARMEPRQHRVRPPQADAGQPLIEGCCTHYGESTRTPGVTSEGNRDVVAMSQVSFAQRTRASGGVANCSAIRE